MNNILSGLFGQHPSQQSSPGMFGNSILSDPLARLQIGAAMMGGQSLGDQIGGGLMAAGQLGQQRKKTLDEQAKANKTLEFLRTNAPELAGAVESGAMTASEAYAQHLQKPKETEYQQRASAAAQYGLRQGTPEFNNFVLGGKLASEAGGLPKYGMQPVFLDGPDGVTVGQLTDAGQLEPSRLPKGFRPLSPYDKSLQSNVGKADAAMVQNLPSARQTAEMTKNLVDGLINDPGLEGAVGPIQGRLPSFRPDSIRVDSKITQLKGRAFLEARQMLKGGGQITDFEGARAEAAMVRMDQAQNEGDFKQALLEFKDAVQAGLAKMEAAAGGGGSMQSFGGAGGLRAVPEQVPSGAGISGQTQNGLKWSIHP